MKAKYNRVSSKNQNTERQELNSNDFNKTYTDICSGSIMLIERPEGNKLINDVESGLIQEIHISSIDRLGRSIIDILTMIDLFNKKNVNVYVENIGMYSLINDKPNSAFNMITSVLGNVAELERNQLLERQRQGIENAKKKGIYKGRREGSSMSKEVFLSKYKKVVKELNSGESVRRTAKICGCSASTVQRVKEYLN